MIKECRSECCLACPMQVRCCIVRTCPPTFSQSIASIGISRDCENCCRTKLKKRDFKGRCHDDTPVQAGIAHESALCLLAVASGVHLLHATTTPPHHLGGPQAVDAVSKTCLSHAFKFVVGSSELSHTHGCEMSQLNIRIYNMARRARITEMKEQCSAIAEHPQTKKAAYNNHSPRPSNTHKKYGQAQGFSQCKSQCSQPTTSARFHAGMCTIGICSMTCFHQHGSRSSQLPKSLGACQQVKLDASLGVQSQHKPNHSQATIPFYDQQLLGH